MQNQKLTIKPSRANLMNFNWCACFLFNN